MKSAASMAAGNLATLATPIAGFQGRDGRLAPESWHPDSSPDDAKTRTGFNFDAAGATETPMITARARAAMHKLDPDRAFSDATAIVPS